jgi:DegV family protein with EDD domain
MEDEMVRIVADTTCSLPRDLTRKLGIPVLPQIIMFGEQTFRDDTELTTEQFLSRLRASPTLPKTSAPQPALYAPVFQEILAAGDSILVVCPSAEVSGTLRSVEVAARDFPDAPIHAIDMRTIAGMLGAAVLQADAWAKQGLPAGEILGRLEGLKARQRTYFVVDTLEYLYKGGRIGGAKRLMGEMLQVKPILRVVDGRVDSFEQQRTKKRAISRLVELVEAECPPGDGSFLCLMQADAEGAAEALAAEWKARLNVKEIPIYELPPAIVTHGGPGILAVGFYAK